MNKAELVAAMADKSGLTKASAEKALNAFTESITDSMKKGERVGLVGFGSFSVTERSARTGRNPQTGAVIQIKAKKVVKYKPGADMAL